MYFTVYSQTCSGLRDGPRDPGCHMTVSLSQYRWLQPKSLVSRSSSCPFLEPPKVTPVNWSTSCVTLKTLAQVNGQRTPPRSASLSGRPVRRSWRHACLVLRVPFWGGSKGTPRRSRPFFGRLVLFSLGWLEGSQSMGLWGVEM